MRYTALLVAILSTFICAAQPQASKIILNASATAPEQWEQLRLTVNGDMDEGEAIVAIEYRYAKNPTWQKATITSRVFSKDEREVKVKFTLPSTGKNLYQILINSTDKFIVMEKIRGNLQVPYYQQYIPE